jgi:hypothetical protein
MDKAVQSAPVGKHVHYERRRPEESWPRPREPVREEDRVITPICRSLSYRTERAAHVETVVPSG